MKDKATKNLTIILLLFVGLTFLYFLISTSFDGYTIWSREKIDFAVTGQFGDFIGGFLGTIINGAAFYFLYLTLNEQRKSSQKQSFETKLYELIRLHRENISELRYTKFHKGELKTSESRKVFRVIVHEFIECYHEVKHFSKIFPDVELINSNYKNELNKIIKRNKVKETADELALIDIAFCFFYFGVSKESEQILLYKFYNRYNKEFTNRCKVFLQLKPRCENVLMFDEWKNFREKSSNEKVLIFEDIYEHAGKSNLPVYFNKYKLFDNLAEEKYYSGHQHRLGHYFRHLFQTYKFLSSQNYLTPDEKYFFGKSIRAQLSTYEQLILLINSLSSLGMQWEYTSEIKPIPDGCMHEDFKFITRYNIIKNLPGSQYYDFIYRKYYPKVKFEYMEDITYSKRISDIKDY